jgi:hypothetical protein
VSDSNGTRALVSRYATTVVAVPLSPSTNVIMSSLDRGAAVVSVKVQATLVCPVVAALIA